MRAQQRGFTLLEMMVALGIFALVSTACYQLLHSLTVSRASLQAASEYRSDIARAMLVIEQDLRALIPRSVRREASLQRIAALSSDPENGAIEFSRSGFPHGRSLSLLSAKRVAYQLEPLADESGFALSRIVYDALDRVEATPSYTQVLLPGVSDIGFRFMDKEGSWQPQWPPQDDTSATDESGQLATDDERLRELPQAIEVAIALAPDRSIQRIISLR